MKILRALIFLTVLLQSFTVHATIFNYDVSGMGLIRDMAGVPYQSTAVRGSFYISDAVGNVGYGGGPSYRITYFELFFDGDQYFTGTGDFFFGDLANSGWISSWRLQGAGDWSFWYGDGSGASPVFYHDDGTAYNQGAAYNTLASTIDLGFMTNTYDSNGNAQFPGSFLLDTSQNAGHALNLTRTGPAPVPEPATVVLLGFGVLLAVVSHKMAARAASRKS